MRSLIATLAAVGAVFAALTAASSAAAASGSGSASCLRGNWVASQGETNRVLRALIPNGGFEATGRLYMIFRDGAFQYGSRQLVLEGTFGEITMIARGRFYTLAPYTARAGVFTTRAGESHIDWGRMTGSKAGRSYTVDGPPPSTTSIPGGPTPFQCRGSTLKVRLPRIASTGWITLQRGTP
jgi:hypothetical protein